MYVPLNALADCSWFGKVQIFELQTLNTHSKTASPKSRTSKGGSLGDHTWPAFDRKRTIVDNVDDESADTDRTADRIYDSTVGIACFCF